MLPLKQTLIAVLMLGLAASVLPGQVYTSQSITNAYATNDISATGTSIKAGWGTLLDDGNQLVTIPFSFTFFGTASTDMRVCTNGWISPTDTATTFSTPAGVPAAGTPNNFIAAYFADLDFNTTYNPAANCFTGTVGTTPNRRFIIQYVGVPHHNSGTPISTPTVSFEIILFETSNDIEVHYNIGGTPTVAGGMGVENATGTTGVAAPGGWTQVPTATMAFKYSTAPLAPTAPVLQSPVAPAASGAILVTEVAADPPGSGDEYVEITNVSSGTVSLAGWTISVYDNGTTNPVFTDNITAGNLAAGARWVFCDFSTATTPTFNQAFSANLIIGSTGWGVVLRNNTGQVMDAVFGGTLAYASITTPATIGSQFSGTNVPVMALGQQAQRQGVGDNNTAADWILTSTHSLGAVNTGLTLPFATSGAFLSIGGTDPSFTATCVVGANLQASFTATDVNTADVLTFTISHTGGTLTPASAGFSTAFPFSPAGGVSPRTATIAGTAASLGTINFSIVVSDGTFQDTYTLAITIVAGPSLSITGGPLALGTTTQGTAGTPQSYTLTGNNFTANLLVTAPTGVEVSQTGAAGTYAASQSITQTGGAVSATIHARIASTATVGAISANITHTSTNLATQNVAVTGTVTAAPAITTSVSTLNLGTTTQGTASSPALSYTVTGSNLTVNVTVTAPTGVEISQTGAAGAYAASQVLTQTGGAVNGTIHARIAAAASVGAISGNITHASTGATTINVSVSGTVTTVVPTIAPSVATLPLGSTPQGTASTPQSYTVTGSNLTVNVTVTAPTGVEISQTGAAGTYAASQVLTQTGGAVNATIHARITAAAAAGAISGNITHASTGATTANVAVTGTVTGAVPTVSTSTGTLALGSTVQGTAGTPQSYTVNGVLLTANVTVTAPTGVELSQTGAAGTYAGVQVLTQTAGSVTATIHARITAAAALGAVAGNITHASAGATTVNVAVNGTVTAPGPSITVNPGTLSLGVTSQGTASNPPQSFTVTGSNLTANVTVTAPTGVEVSQTGAAGPFAASQILTQTGGAANGTIHARISATAAVGTINANITSASTGASTQNVTVTGTVNAPGAPNISVPAGTLNFTSTGVGAPSAAQSYVVTGTSLTSQITVTAPATFEVATVSTGPFSASIMLPQAGGTVFVRYNPTALGGNSGNISHAATPATTVNKAVSGTIGSVGGGTSGGGGGGGGCAAQGSDNPLGLGAILLALLAAVASWRMVSRRAAR